MHYCVVVVVVVVVGVVHTIEATNQEVKGWGQRTRWSSLFHLINLIYKSSAVRLTREHVDRYI